MLKKQSVRLGKLVKYVMKARGGGSALPGLIVEKINPTFLRDTLAQLPYGVVVVSGTNGKTTTTKIIAQLLRSQGLRVFTNPSGSNFTRGIVASLLSHIDNNGTLHADIAVVELDEAHAVHFVQTVPPRYTVILNVLRDQLDRFGEIDHTAQLLKKVVEKTTEGVVLNRDDELVKMLSSHVPHMARVAYFGVSKKLKHFFPSDAELHNEPSTTDHNYITDGTPADVIVHALTDNTAAFVCGGKKYPPTRLKLRGIYNVVNAAAALCTTRMILGATSSVDELVGELGRVAPAFGRGEAIDIAGAPLEIILVKNPSGFRLSLASYGHQPAATMIAINDSYADGRDMSWLWDVDFSALTPHGVQFVSGVRAYDMAVRLQYDNVTIDHIIPDIHDALFELIRTTTGVRRIYCTYTAMLTIRRALAKQYTLEAIE